MQEARLKTAAQALGDMTLFQEHEIGEIETLTLRDYLDEVSRDEASSPLVVDQVLERMVRIVMESYQKTA
jgi:hypothetical protein